MADFVAVLRKTLDGLGETTPEVRAKVYDKARSTIAAKLAAIDPPPPAAVAERQKRGLEDAIVAVEKTYAKPAPASDPLAELENIFSSIDRNRNQPSHARPAAPASTTPATARTEPAWQPPQPAKPAAAPEEARPKTTPVEMDWRKSPSVEQRPKPVQSPVGEPYAATGHRPQEARLHDSALSGARPLPPLDDPAAIDGDDDFPAAGPAAETMASGRGERRRNYGGLIAAVIALAVIAGGGYGVWLNKDAFKNMLGIGKTDTAAATKPAATPPAKPAETAAAKPAEPAPAPAAQEPASAPASTGEAPKFTQRLLPDGKETDPGPAGGASTIGEGTSVVALTTQPPPVAAPAAGAATPAPAANGTAPAATATPPPATGGETPAAAATPPAAPPANAPAAGTPAAPAANGEQAAVPVGQKAIFYEERTSSAEGSAEPGSIVWSLVQESPGGDAPPEPAIRAEATIPGKNMQLRMTIRRNADQTLPASHIVEMIFLTPDGFEGGGIDNVLRIAMKSTEQEAGSPLIGIPAKIADGFFLVALNDTKADESANLALLRNQDWIDIPVVYKSGRRALLTMEKGIPGEKVFDEALKAWEAKTSG
ncbi:MAG: hypothetical protein J0I98_04820 [Mesorhizobium sp.]|nr:hypothetical protein [Mesorhizobium sp.]MBN9242096.1 hypothetical protein [Mesorhizobium sp.]